MIVTTVLMNSCYFTNFHLNPFGPTLKWVQKTWYLHRKSANNRINYITKIQLFETLASVNPDYNRKNRDVSSSITIIAVFLFAMSVSILNGSTLDHHTAVTDVYAQSYVETVKHRNLTIDLGNGLKTNAQLTLPSVGEGPFPGILLIHGSGTNDLNETGGLILVDNKTGIKKYPDKQTFFQIAEHLSERGFVCT